MIVSSLAWIEDPRLLEQARDESGLLNGMRFVGGAGTLSRCGERGKRLSSQSRLESEEYCAILVALMESLGVSEADQTFTKRTAPIRMDTKAPVFSVPMNFVEISGNSDPSDKTKKNIIAHTPSILNGVTRTHPLRKYPLYPGGSADVEWCDKHALSCAVKIPLGRLCELSG
jgi:hypothetical protein